MYLSLVHSHTIQLEHTKHQEIQTKNLVLKLLR